MESAISLSVPQYKTGFQIDNFIKPDNVHDGNKIRELHTISYVMKEL